jgi:predicted RecA/RadA family phage recombinase
MRILLLSFTAALLMGCAAPQYLAKGTHDGVEVAYRWSHPANKPSELLLRLKNTTENDKQIELVIDVAYQGRTVESLSADTCIKAGQELNGKLNGIYFIPTRVTTQQIKDGGVDVDLTRTTVAPCERP